MGLDESMSDTPESHNGGFSQQQGSYENVFENPSFYVSLDKCLNDQEITCLRMCALKKGANGGWPLGEKQSVGVACAT